MDRDEVKCIKTSNGQKRYYKNGERMSKQEVKDYETKYNVKIKCKDPDAKKKIDVALTREELQKLPVYKLKLLCKQLGLRDCTAAKYKTVRQKDAFIEHILKRGDDPRERTQGIVVNAYPQIPERKKAERPNDKKEIKKFHRPTIPIKTEDEYLADLEVNRNNLIRMKASNLMHMYEERFPCIINSKIPLRHYQRAVVEYFTLQHANFGMVVVHKTGRGKTLTAVASSQCFLHDNPDKKVILITKATLIDNFKKELGEKGRTARVISQMLDKCCQNGSLVEGVCLQNGSKLRHRMGKAGEKVGLEKDHHAACTF